ncbi:hypothetical protein BVC80_659g12 [Macleaya cordata]|uniref:Uncharacterized protein n=1 Tax=Macleaya cordata TaxID=56857 RepID=A0A200QFB9_MACCD|nr:hypothetical protein BVC80_659g12 [Macleaya cordata]
MQSQMLYLVSLFVQSDTEKTVENKEIEKKDEYKETEKTDEEDRGERKNVEVEVKEKENQGVGLLGAVGETIVEIAQNAKELVVGEEKVDPKQHEHQQ